MTALQLLLHILPGRLRLGVPLAFHRAFLASLLVAVLAVGCAAVSTTGSSTASPQFRESLSETSSPSNSGVKRRPRVEQRVAILVAVDPGRRKPKWLRDRSVPEPFALHPQGDRAAGSPGSLPEIHPQNERQVSFRPRPFYSQAPPRLSS